MPLHLVAAAVVVTGAALQLVRPLAPDLGPPPPPESAFDATYLARAASYRTPLYAAMVAALLVRLGVAAWAALHPAGRRVVARIISAVGSGRPARAAATVVVGVVVASDVVLLPLVFWAGFVHDGSYGLRTQGLGGWFYDWGAYRVPVWLAIGVMALVGYALARRAPLAWAPVGGMIAAVLTVGVTYASPLVLEPLTNRFTALEPGAVRDEVERVLAAAGEEDVTTILVADASRRNTLQNAYISGLSGSERVVLYDNLVEQRPPAEVGIVLAHEVAHHRHGDVARLAALGAAGAIAAAYVLRVVLALRTRRGDLAGHADPRGAALVVVTLVALNIVSMPLQSAVSRRAEAAADARALAFTDAPQVFTAMQQGLTRANLNEPLPPRAVTLWFGSHPPPMARIGMARWWAQR